MMVINVKNVQTSVRYVHRLQVVRNAKLVIIRILIAAAKHVRKIALKAYVIKLMGSALKVALAVLERLAVTNFVQIVV